ncbi:MAG: hypothetical protein AB7T27_01425 [Kiritimatiellia bacterium]
MKTFSILIMFMFPFCLPAETVYLTSDSAYDGIGGFDVNIMADDIHLNHSAIITNITLPLAIAGTQICGLWIFESLNSPALHYWPFVNSTSSNDQDMKIYSFGIHAVVPKDFYIGFSAQGGGWNTTSSDYVRCGSSVLTGVASNNGVFYYGSVSGGQLTAEYAPGYPAFFTIQVKEAPLHISALQPAGGGIEISATNFYPGTTNHVERNINGSWIAVTNFVAGSSGANWIDTQSNGHALFRLRRE